MSLSFNYPSYYELACIYSVAGVVTSEEEYRTNAVIQGGCHSEVHGTGRTFDVIMSSVTVSDPTKRYGLHVVTDNDGRQTLTGDSNYNVLSFSCIATSSSGSISQDTGELPYMVANYNYAENTTASYTTNIPIFDTAEHKEQYISASTDAIALEILSTYALNYSGGEVVPDGMDFQILQSWTTSEWINDIQPQVNFVNYLGVRGRLVSGRLRLYTIDGINDGCLKDGVLLDNSPEFFGLEVTTDGTTWTPTDTFPYEWIYRKRKNELGTFSYALTSSYIPIPHFPNKDDAENDPDENADNWDEISPFRPPQNPTGDPDEDPTEMGEVYTRSFFSQQYICSATALQEIANKFFDTTAGGIFEDIKKGCEMYGEHIIDDIQNVMFFPVNLNEVFTGVQLQNYIYFGGYQCQLSSNISKIIYPNGYKDFGSFVLSPTFKNYRDYAPFQRLYVYLAYCGWYELDIARYIGKTVSIRYYFDTRTGGCLACLFANGILTDYYNGQCGVSMPITMTDFTAYANAQIQTLLGLNKPETANAGIAGDFAKNFGVGAVESGVMSAGALGVASLGVGAGVSVTKTLYGLTQNNINNFNKTKGGSTSMLNQYLPQNCLFMFEVQDVDETSNANSLYGSPCNASGTLQNFNGYLEVETVKLNCAGATVNEQNEIIAQLQNGVYI